MNPQKTLAAIHLTYALSRLSLATAQLWAELIRPPDEPVPPCSDDKLKQTQISLHHTKLAMKLLREDKTQ